MTACFVFSLDRDLLAPEPSRLILDRRGDFLGEVAGFGDRLGYWPMGVIIPKRILAATLETEDRYFFHHPGVYWPSVLRALRQNLSSGRIVSGASTIPMQVARMQSPGERSYLRKAKEAAEALLLVHDFGHQRVLAQYLRMAPYGNRVHGVNRAARYYFDKPAEDLSWLQAAFLAGLPQAPGRYDPHRPGGLARALERAERILRALAGRGVIGRVELEQALGSALQLVPRPERSPEALHAVLRWSKQASSRPGVIQQATLDLDLQGEVSRILGHRLRELRGRGVGNAAALVVDLPSGEILAYVGSDDYFADEPCGAIDYVQARRPPGSALKPFLYALGLEHGRFSAASELADVQVEFDLGRGMPYRPSNISHTFLGPMLFRQALGNSRNIPALHVLSAVGVEPALRFFYRAGVRGISFEPNRYGLGLALGNLHVSLEDLCGLYGVLAHGGKRLPFRLFVDEPKAEQPRLLGGGTTELITHILGDPLARSPSFPRGTAVEYDSAVAVKTGTSQGYRDSWTVAYNDRLLVGVWMGNHDWRRMNRVGGLTGAGVATRRIMDALMPAHRPHVPLCEQFSPPDDYLARTVCPLSGKLAGPDCPDRHVEYFAPGTEPVALCSVHRMVAVDRRNGLRATAACPAGMVEKKVMLDLPDRYAAWARRARLEVAPNRESPLCGVEPRLAEALIVEEPRNGSRYLYDPDTPAEFATLRLSARVEPADEPIVWLVDGLPVARVEFPHEFRWSLEPGTHTIRAAMARTAQVSSPVTIIVAD